MPELSQLMPQQTIGKRIEIPVHYNYWMQGARFGEITAYFGGKAGKSAYYSVKMDNKRIKRRLKLWSIDWEYAKLI